MVRKLFGSLDVSLAPDLPDKGPERGGVRLILDPDLDAVEALRRRLYRGTVGHRPEALSPVSPEALPELLTVLSDQVEVGMPIDFALSLAWLQHGHGDLAPVFLVPIGYLPEKLKVIGPYLSVERAILARGFLSLIRREKFWRREVGAYRRIPLASYDFALHDRFTPSSYPTPLFGPPLKAEVERFADLLLYQGFHYGTLSPAGAPRLVETAALRPRSSYTLEVAIRQNPIGITAIGTARPVENPPDRADPCVLAVVSCRQANAPQFQDRLLPITWPRDADSTAALFRFQTGDALPAEPLCFEIRLYARAGLQLLDLLELRFDQGRWAKRQPEIGRLAAPAALPAEDAVSFHVAAKSGGYDFEVVFIRNGEAHLDAPLGRLVSNADLETLLRRVRSFWTDLVIGKLAKRKQLSEPSYAEELGHIMELGAVAWRTLFGDRCGAQAGTPEALSEVLRRNPLPCGTPIRVTLASDADAFVFPWAMLCPPSSRQEAPNPELIWGLRYRIELAQKYREPYSWPVMGGKVRIATVLDPGFANSVDHAATLSNVAKTGVGAELIPSQGTKQEVLDGLEVQPPADIYYYFCHGFAPGRAAVLASDLLRDLRKLVPELKEEDAKRLWDALLDRLEKGSDVAAMFTGAAWITEDDLRRAAFFTKGRPIVFLNMCHSADLLPSLRSGLTRVFIDRNAAAVLGTECAVTSIFADMFAEQLLGALLRGLTIGEALLEARRHFHAERNPLGLLYTLYGHDDARVTDTDKANEAEAA